MVACATPRTLVSAILAAAALAASGCGATTTPTPSAAAADTSSDAQPMVLALDDFAALHALTLGVQPDLVLEAFSYETTSAIFESLDLQTGVYGSELDLEAIAAAGPDVIIGMTLPTTASVEDQLDAIAPTTIVDYTASWDQQLTATAQALDRADEAEAVRRRVATQTEQLAADLQTAGQAGRVASVIADNGGFFSPPQTTSVGSVLSAVGLARPTAQQQPVDPTSPFITFTAETLTDHDADEIFLLSGGAYTTEGLTASPLWPNLRAVTSGAVAEVNGEVWLSSSAFSVAWILDDIRAVILGEGDVGTATDAAQRFATFANA